MEDLDKTVASLKEEIATWRDALELAIEKKTTVRELKYLLTYKPEEKVDFLIEEIKKSRGR